MKYYFII